jgi:thioredoxin 1
MLKILYFSAPWCGPCKALKPAIDKLELELDPELVQISRINIDENKVEASAYNILSIPTLIFLKDDIMVNALVGIKPINDIKSIINQWK